MPGLHRPVSSQYADGLFTQHPNSSGQVYNVCHSSKELFLVLQLLYTHQKEGGLPTWSNPIMSNAFWICSQNRIFIVSALAAVSWQCGQAAVGGGETPGDGGSAESQTGVAQLRKVSTTRSTSSPYEQAF